LYLQIRKLNFILYKDKYLKKQEYPLQKIIKL